MASTSEYLDYLDQQVGIAPANSQEELQAAQLLADLFRGHGLETTVQEFDASAASPLLRGILQALLFVGVFLSGVGLTIPGVLIALVAGGLLLADGFGYGVLTGFARTARSQNVIAFHPATGELVTKGSRPIVIVAHYDTPRESILAKPEFAPFQAMLRTAAFWGVPVAAVLSIFQLFFAEATTGRRVVWLLALIAALPALLLGIAQIMERFAPCTEGANDNKSSVAALLGIMQRVTRAEVQLDMAARPKRAPAGAEAYGVRHGAEVVASLGMLPEDCEIVYEEAPVEESADPYADALAAAEEKPAQKLIGGISKLFSKKDEEKRDVYSDPESLDLSEEGDVELKELPEGEIGVKAGPGPVLFEVPPVDESPYQGDGDASGLIATDDPDATAAMEVEDKPSPKTPEDPSWGSSDFTPNQANVARRAVLFDLPDPSADEADPLAGPASTGATDSTPSFMPAAPAADETVVVDLSHRKPAKGSEQGDESLSEWLGVDDAFDAKSGGRQIGSWDNFNDEDNWKGGATIDSSLRGEGSGEADGLPENPFARIAAETADEPIEDEVVEEAEETAAEDVPGEEELRDAILSMNDDALIAHDIWFVALGASGLDHAGMDAFLSEYRSTCRGSFVINLDCVGGGQLTALNREGIHASRRADRRILRLLTSTAGDLHIDLAQASHAWGDTDVTAAMRSSMRSVTLMGLDITGQPALSKTAADVYDNVDPDQAAHVAELVCELIRRS